MRQPRGSADRLVGLRNLDHRRERQQLHCRPRSGWRAVHSAMGKDQKKGPPVVKLVAVRGKWSVNEKLLSPVDQQVSREIAKCKLLCMFHREEQTPCDILASPIW